MNFPELTRRDGVIENNKPNIEIMLDFMVKQRVGFGNQGKIKRIEMLYMSGSLTDEKFRELFAQYQWIKNGKPKRVR